VSVSDVKGNRRVDIIDCKHYLARSFTPTAVVMSGSTEFIDFVNFNFTTCNMDACFAAFDKDW
jgi:hypothetical protein